MSLARAAFPLLRPILRALEPEAAHRLTLSIVKRVPGGPSFSSPALGVDCFGLRFPNPLGLAAGFDKNAEAPDSLLKLGFGFVEVGTVTPRPQAGNDRPRLFRLEEDEAVINRMGFNNLGFGVVRRHLEQRRTSEGIVGVNIGANRTSQNRIGDYVQGVEAFGELANYIVLNVSSPNTAGLRDLQSREALQELLNAVNEARRSRPMPLLVKIAPDLDDGDLEDIAAACSNGAVDGIVVSNTTVARPALRSANRRERGGLSGKPLFAQSTRVLARLYGFTRGIIPLVGAGGISNAETAWTKIEAGASLLQLYTALVFRGPGVISDILGGLEAKLTELGLRSLEEVRGSRADAIARNGLGEWMT